MSFHLTPKKAFTKVRKIKYNNLMISKVKDKPMKNRKAESRQKKDCS